MTTKMKHFRLLVVLSVVVVLCLSVSAPQFAIAQEGGEFGPIPLDDLPHPDYDFSRANKLPLTGYFEKTFDVNGEIRTAKFYIPATTPIRQFFSVIAVPGGIDTTEFLIASGWHDIADATEEGVVLLEPGKGGWKAPEEELPYVNAVIDFYKNNKYFSIFGLHYFVGYGKGGAALEAWATANPLFVISQVYVDTESLSQAYYAQFANKYFDGKSSGYTPIEIPAEYSIAYNEVPVPTWFINRDLSRISRGIAYWKAANDCVDKAVIKRGYLFDSIIYAQSPDSDAWQTDYCGPISKVALLEKEVDILNPKVTQTIYGFLSEYTRYDNTSAWGNQLGIRKPYGEIRTMLVNGYLREYMIYVPESAGRLWPDGAPVLFVFAGNTQTDKVFWHATQWWTVADEEGIILVIPCEQYAASPVSVSHRDLDVFYLQLAELVKKQYNVDPTRFYATGQSAGSFAAQGFGITNPQWFAAIASTAGVSAPGIEGGPGQIAEEQATYEMMPTYVIIGEGDIADMTGTLWDDTENWLDYWADYYLKANGLEKGDGSNRELNGRFETWAWYNEQGFPLVKLTRTLHRAHNCIPAEMPLCWEFLKDWSLKDGVRYYKGVPVAPKK